MIRILIRAAVYLVSAALGIIVAGALLDGMTVHFAGFIVGLLVFTAAQLILGPFLSSLVSRNAEAFVGGVGLLSTFVALLLANLIGANGIQITGASTWISATVIVWLVTAIATVALPWILVKAGVQSSSDRRADNTRA